LNDTKFKPKHDVKFSFTVQRHSSGSFKNLWDLDVTYPDGEVVKAVDADSLSLVIDKIGYIFEKEGY